MVVRVLIGAGVGAVAALGYGALMRAMGGTCTFACDPLVGGPLGALLGGVAELVLGRD